MSLLLAILLLVGVVGALAAGPVRAAGPDCTVKSSGGDYTAIQPAINDAGCATITVDPGTYNENLTINRSLTLQGAGQTSTIIDGNGVSRVMTITGASTEVYLYDLQITGGDATAAPTTRFGGGIFVTGGAILRGENLQIDDNLASSQPVGFGGGVAIDNGSAYLTSTMIFSNTANRRADPFTGNGVGGGLYVNNGTLYLVDSQVMNNLAGYRAAGAGTSGGGLYVSGSTEVSLSGNTWQGNVARGSNSDPCDTGCANLNNIQGGGAIGVFASAETANIAITGDTFTGNVDNDVTAVTENSGRGGGIFLNATSGVVTATLNNITMTQNIAARQSVANEEGQGGAIYARRTVLTVQRARIFDNQAAASGSGSGGGIYTRQPPSTSGDFQVINTILAGNTAPVSGNGGQLYANFTDAGSHNVKIRHVTIADDTLNSKQGIYFDGDASDRLLITNTIVASHTTGIQNAGNPGETSTDYLLLFANTTDLVNVSAPPNQETGQPRFANPTGNDYHLSVGSTAIDTGTNDDINNDIDLDFRPQGVGFDIGADEAVAKLTISKSGPSVAALGTPITYTLTVKNSGPLTATNLLITDTIPSGATHNSGGTLAGNEVQWNVPSLEPGGTFSSTFSVIAGQDTIVNDDYRVSADGNISATGAVAVQTSASAKIYLPIVIK